MNGRVGQLLGRWFETPAERQWLGSLCATTAVHLGVLTLLAMIVFAAPDRPPRPAVESAWQIESLADEPAPLLHLDSPAPSDPNPTAGGSVTTELTAAEVVTDPLAVDPSEVALLEPTFDGGEPEPDAESERTTGRRSGDDGQPVSGSGGGTGTGVGNGDGSGFFGISQPGRRFVYVVDASSSMQAKHDSEAKTRFGRVKLELVKSIGGMTHGQSFFVIYFNSEPRPMPARALQPALPNVQRHYLDWTTRFRAGGDTNPLPALELALALRPDVIYFLTDGEIPRGRNVLRTVSGLNRGRVRVHTFAFGVRSGEEMMKALAEQNGGEYRFVP